MPARKIQETFVTVGDETREILVSIGEDMLTRLKNKLERVSNKERSRLLKDIQKVNRLVEELKRNG